MTSCQGGVEQGSQERLCRISHVSLNRNQGSQEMKMKMKKSILGMEDSLFKGTEMRDRMF